MNCKTLDGTLHATYTCHTIEMGYYVRLVAAYVQTNIHYSYTYLSL